MLNWILYNSPLQNGVLTTSSVYAYLSDRFDISQAGFATLAAGGFGDGQLTLADVPDATLDDLENWLGKRVVATDGEGNLVYEGFIGEIEWGRGHHSFRRSLDPLINRARITYLTSYKTTTELKTALVDQTVSQAKYGIKYGTWDISSEGLMDLTQAQAIGQTYLNVLATPKQHRTLIASGALGVDPGNVSLTLWGYVTTLKWQQTKTLAWKAATEIATIVKTTVTQAVCQFVNPDTSFIATTNNTVAYNSTGSWVDPYKLIFDVIAFGAGTPALNHRLLFQLWGGRVAYLNARPTTASYWTTSQLTRLRDAGRAPVMPWLVRAGKYVVFEDLPAPSDVFKDAAGNPDIDLDPRAVLIEQTHWDDVAETLTLDPTTVFAIQLPLTPRRKNRKKARQHHWLKTEIQGGGGASGTAHPGRRYGRQVGATAHHHRRRK